ncbi:MAG TPA: hypothetical protein VKR21_11450 [Solirubrobacteraceae bacterium]|nr:hypothetical protein [Solirubrobacteraceae bacterium]
MARDDLCAITAEATGARGPAAGEVTRKPFSMVFRANGPDYWR